MCFHESRNCTSRDHHDQYRDDNCGDHHFNVLGHTDCCDYGIQGKDDIEKNDLDDDRHKGRRLASRLVMLSALQLFMNFKSAFAHQEESAEKKDQVASGEAVTGYVEPRIG